MIILTNERCYKEIKREIRYFGGEVTIFNIDDYSENNVKTITKTLRDTGFAIAYRVDSVNNISYKFYQSLIVDANYGVLIEISPDGFHQKTGSASCCGYACDDTWAGPEFPKIPLIKGFTELNKSIKAGFSKISMGGDDNEIDD